MSRTVVAVFDTYARAQHAAHQMEKKGFSHSDISVLAHDHRGEYSAEATGEGIVAATGAGTGAAIGGATGIALSLVALAIPGIGPVVALGPLAAALTGAGIGAVAGGLIGAMTALGVPEADAHIYAGRIQQGHALVMVKTMDSGRADFAAALLEDLGAGNVDESSRIEA